MANTETKVEEVEEHVHDHNCSHGHHAVGQTVTNPNKIGRNDPCFCGSGKKFKKCCLQ